MTTTQSARNAVHPHVEMLRAIYADLSKIADYAADAIVLHRADRSTKDHRVVCGVQDVLAYEQALVGLTGNTLVMDVDHITANDHFGAVLGTLRASSPQKIAMPFCGLWRFAGGLIVEHWENAYDPASLQHMFIQPTSQPASS